MHFVDYYSSKRNVSFHGFGTVLEQDGSLRSVFFAKHIRGYVRTGPGGFQPELYIRESYTSAVHRARDRRTVFVSVCNTHTGIDSEEWSPETYARARLHLKLSKLIETARTRVLRHNVSAKEDPAGRAVRGRRAHYTSSSLDSRAHVYRQTDGGTKRE
jgi:hypothetical protein